MENQNLNCPFCNGERDKQGKIQHQSIFCYMNISEKQKRREKKDQVDLDNKTKDSNSGK